MRDQGRVVGVVDVAALQSRHDALLPWALVAEERQQHGGDDEQEDEDEPAAVGEVAEEFLEFVTDAALVIHNAEFDLRFLNWELENAGRERLNNRVVDTMIMARQKYPGAQASLDALCKRFEIDLSGREKHGALLDGQLLAQVYLEMVGGRQPGLDLAGRKTRGPALRVVGPDRPKREPRLHLAGAAPTPEEAAAHDAFVAKMKDPLWRRLGGG